MASKWLKQNNPLYGAVRINDDNLRTLPENDVLPYHVEQVSCDDAQEAVISRYDNLRSDSSNTVVGLQTNFSMLTYFRCCIRHFTHTVVVVSKIRAGSNGYR